MDPHHTARLLAMGRIAVGATLVIAPGLATRALGGARPSRTAALFARTMGARDLALGVGAFTALADGRDAARWVRLGAAADALDSAAVLLAARELGSVGTAVGSVVAATAAAIGARSAEAIED